MQQMQVIVHNRVLHHLHKRVANIYHGNQSRLLLPYTPRTQGRVAYYCISLGRNRLGRQSYPTVTLRMRRFILVFFFLILFYGAVSIDFIFGGSMRFNAAEQKGATIVGQARVVASHASLVHGCVQHFRH